jgi:hypothetical protein
MAGHRATRHGRSLTDKEAEAMRRLIRTALNRGNTRSGLAARASVSNKAMTQWLNDNAKMSEGSRDRLLPVLKEVLGQELIDEAFAPVHLEKDDDPVAIEPATAESRPSTAQPPRRPQLAVTPPAAATWDTIRVDLERIVVEVERLAAPLPSSARRHLKSSVVDALQMVIEEFKADD